MFRFSEALFVKESVETIIKPEDIDILKYRKRYKGYLFCPHPGCKAKLSFVKRGVRRYFRTWRKDPHSDECPYRLEYEEEVQRRRKLNPEYKSNISDEHVNQVLRRAYKIESGEYSSSPKPSLKKQQFNEVKEHMEEYGIASFEGDSSFSGARESNIYLRKVEDLRDLDNWQIRCVIGKAESMYISENFSYINFISQNIRVKIHFNEHFKSTNETQYKLLDYIKQYILENNGCTCICVGEVVYVPSGIDIRPDRYNGFSINGLKLYEVVNKYISLV